MMVHPALGPSLGVAPWGREQGGGIGRGGRASGFRGLQVALPPKRQGERRRALHTSQMSA